MDLDHTSPTICDIPGLQCSLYPHQQTILHRIVELEDAGMVTVKLPLQHLTSAPAMIQSNSIVLSEPFGSGKTAVIIALVLLRPVPRAHYSYTTEKNGTFYNARAACSTKISRQTAIIVGSAVAVQWQNSIAAIAPQLRLFSVVDSRSFRKFQELVTSGEIVHVDVVLVRVAEFIDGGKKKNLITAVGDIGVTFARVVYDDYDSIGIPARAQTLAALKSIFVSATRRIRPRLTAGGRCILAAASDDTLYDHFNVRNKKSFTEASVNLPAYNSYRCVYDSSFDNIVRLIWVLGRRDVVDLINSDLTCAAAELVGETRAHILHILSSIVRHTKKACDRGDIVAIEHMRMFSREIAGIRCTQCAAAAATFISGCCGAVFCDVCMNSVLRKYNNCIGGVCGRCRRNISVDHTPVHLLRGKTYKTKIPVVHETLDVNAGGAISPKLRAVSAILAGIPPSGYVSYKLSLMPLLVGGDMRECPPEIPRKILIYTGFSRSAAVIAEYLSAISADHAILQGNCGERQNIVECAKKHTRPFALIAAALTDCAGINMEFMTDLVLYHAPADRGVLAQIFGRVQRIGRVYSANIWHLCYKNELK